MKLVECVPNFSEGRDKAKIDEITAVIKAVNGVELLDVDPGYATNRTVVTFAGAPDDAIEAAFQVIKKASQVIDMRIHHGEHPRHGATDVCPFVPVSGITMEECAELARKLGARVGKELGIPVYLYEHAASRPERRNLADVRAGEYEALAKKLGTSEWAPDFGPNVWNEKVARTGVVTIGARKFLVAYNINLNTSSVKKAKDIAFQLREKGLLKRDASGNKVIDKNGESVFEPGLFKNCKATGWFIPEYNRAQITMNLTDYEVSPVHEVFDAACDIASKMGVRVTGSELVGLVPKDAMMRAGIHYLKKQGASTGVSEEHIIRTAMLSLGLDDVAKWEPSKKIIEYRFEKPRPLISMTTRAFVEETASDSPAPGGGSVAALCGALSGALSAMVASLTYDKKGYTEHNAAMCTLGENAHNLKTSLLCAIDDDTEAFNGIMSAMKLSKTTDTEKCARAKAILEATKVAIDVPYSVLEKCPELLNIAKEAILKGNQNSVSDVGVAALCARTAAYGAWYNVLINAKGIDDTTWITELKSKCDKIISEVDKLSDEIESLMKGKLA